MKKIFIISVICALALAVAVSVSVKRNISRGLKASEVSKETALKPPAVKEKVESVVRAVKGELDIRNAFIKVAETAGPAVVAISTERTQKVGFPQQQFFSKRFGGRSPFGGEDPFEKFFQDFFGQFPEREFKQRGLGSGVIIDERGYVLTNEHVVAEAEKIVITLADGRNFTATVKGADPRSDIAVLQIEAKDLPVAELGDSDLIQTGEWVVALGNPYGHILQSPVPTVTVGVVSAMHRHIPTPNYAERGYLDLIQTDAAINQGNSGGPLCDLEGRVIGINVAILSTSGGYQGVGFAIPINIAKEILEDLIKGREIEYGWLGVHVQAVTEEMAPFFGLKDAEGALIGKIIPDSPAEKAGLKEGDVITSFNGEKVKGVNDLLAKISRTRVGNAVTVDVTRDKKPLALKVTIGKRPVTGEVVEEKPAEPAEKETKVWKGIVVAPVTDAIKQQLGLADTSGVVIMQIDPNGPSYEAGLREGDVIKEINLMPVKDIYDYNKITSKLGEKALVRTERGYFLVK